MKNFILNLPRFAQLTIFFFSKTNKQIQKGNVKRKELNMYS